MKHLKLLIFTSFLLMFINSSLGQSRGYLGKKFSMEVNLNNGFAETTNINLKKNRQYNFYPEFTFAYTIGRRVDVGVLLSRDVVDVDLEPLVFSFANNHQYTPTLDPVYNDELIYFFFIPSEPKNQGVSESFQLFFRFYKKNNIAPVGFYHQISFGINRISFKNRIVGTLKHQISSEIPLELKIQDYSYAKLTYFIGNKRVFTNGIYINSGVNVNIPFAKSLTLLSKSYRQNSGIYHYKYLNQLKNEFGVTQFMEFKIGLGIIF